MLIGNPIYDTVFKFLMEDTEVAKRIISILIDEEIEELTFRAQEKVGKVEVYPLSLFRMDFVAKIKTENGHKNVLIEVQKAKRATDIVRFRSYLGKKYEEREQDGKIEYGLPIIAIYFLGYTLGDLPDAVIKVERSIKGILSNQYYEVRNHFIECLTHDAYMIQVPLLKEKIKSPVEQVLSIFNQNYQTLDKAYILDYPEEVIPIELSPILKRLQKVTADSSVQEQLELEQEIELEYNMSIGLSQGKINELEEEKEILLSEKEALSQEKEVLSQEKEALSQEKEALSQEKEALSQEKEALESKLKGAIQTFLKTSTLTDEEIATMFSVSVEFVKSIR